MALALFLFVIATAAYLYDGRFTAIDVIEGLCLACTITGLILSWPFEKAGIIIAWCGVLALVSTDLLHYKDGKAAIVYILFAIPPGILAYARMMESDQPKKP